MMGQGIAKTAMVKHGRIQQTDQDRFRLRWSRVFEDGDPFFNPNLALIGEETLALACPPRRTKPWRSAP